MPDPKTEDRSDAMEEDLHKLDENIADAKKKLEARKEDAAIADDVIGEGDLAEGEVTGGAGDDDAPQDEDRAGDDVPKHESRTDGEPADPS